MMIQIDGSFGEGGGQIVRTSLTLSLITGKPFEIYNIRARRKRPGLQPQHLKCVEAATLISDSKVKGNQKGSIHLIFNPGQVLPGDYESILELPVRFHWFYILFIYRWHWLKANHT